jgi:hypothetical protein
MTVQLLMKNQVKMKNHKLTHKNQDTRNPPALSQSIVGEYWLNFKQMRKTQLKSLIHLRMKKKRKRMVSI